MKLENFLEKRGGVITLARQIGVVPEDVSAWKTGRRNVPIVHCVAIERATNGQVTRKDLRPNDWMDIWPELVEKGE